MTEKRDDIQLIALDMDGTLLTDDLEVSEMNRTMITKAMDKGVKVMLSTGRWLDFCYSYAESLQLNNYLVTVNGGEIWTSTKELVERHVHANELVVKMWNIGLEKDVHMWCVSTDQVFNSQDRPKDFDAHEWLKIGYSTEDIDKLKEIRKELSVFDDIEITNSLPTNIEVNPSGVNKANGLKRVCKELGITMDQVMAVGDSMNDKKMIMQAGLGIAMGNAQDQIKEVADAVTDTNNNHGVAKAIERFIL
ncbi:MAG TPA: Cof-type HAD-IIB family hydrolase [Candidatus Dormibacteraeota bacterium]|nr:Cof-type HAD-IIB family hydrolase [Candidatus Dormibacteraeota bacterium]